MFIILIIKRFVKFFEKRRNNIHYLLISAIKKIGIKVLLVFNSKTEFVIKAIVNFKYKHEIHNLNFDNLESCNPGLMSLLEDGVVFLPLLFYSFALCTFHYSEVVV